VVGSLTDCREGRRGFLLPVGRFLQVRDMDDRSWRRACASAAGGFSAPTGQRNLINVRFAPKATEVLRHRELTRCAASGHLAGYSITSSARASSSGGTSRPSALAVLRLITSSIFTASQTGRLVHDDCRAAHLRENDCVAGHIGLELGNVVANYPFESSRRFPG
jgi:hypothetical protein